VAVQLNVDGCRKLLFFRSGLRRISYDPPHVRVEMLKNAGVFPATQFSQGADRCSPQVSIPELCHGFSRETSLRTIHRIREKAPPV
jgi:hypothetical protein